MQHNCQAHLFTLQQAQADLEVTSENLRKQFPDTHATVTVRVAPLLDSVVGDFTSTLWLVGASVGLLLMIACANIAGLNLARGLERQKEMTIRASLGASKFRLIRQLPGETMAVVCAAAIGGFFLAQAGVSLIRWLAPSGLPRLDEIHFDVGAFLLVTAVTAVMSIVSGFFPAVALAKTNLASTLRGEGGLGATVGPQRQRLQHGLIIFQVALASLLLFACVLLARSFEALENAPLGFNPRGVLVTNIYLPDSKYGTIPQCRAFFDSLPAEQYVPFQTYYPFGQPHPFRTTDSGTLVVRTDGNPGALMPAVQKIVTAMDPDVPVMTR
jgi:putative ABC transport system permease protein